MAAKKAQIRAMFKDGKKLAVIAKRVKLSVGGVQWHLKH